MRLYAAFVRSVPFHIAGTWDLTGSETEHSDAFLRTQLRPLIGIHWPQRLTITKFCKRCRCRHISADVFDIRSTYLATSYDSAATPRSLSNQSYFHICHRLMAFTLPLFLQTNKRAHLFSYNTRIYFLT